MLNATKHIPKVNRPMKPAAMTSPIRWSWTPLCIITKVNRIHTAIPAIREHTRFASGVAGILRSQIPGPLDEEPLLSFLNPAVTHCFISEQCTLRLLLRSRLHHMNEFFPSQDSEQGIRSQQGWHIG